MKKEEESSGTFGCLIQLGILSLLVYFIVNYFRTEEPKPGEVKIGDRIYTTNISITEDPMGHLKLVSTDEEWIERALNEQPACRYINGNRSAGIMYNLYAYRMLCLSGMEPQGWNYMGYEDWRELHDKMLENVENYYAFRIDNSVLGGFWWCGNRQAVRIEEVPNGIAMDTLTASEFDGFPIRMVKEKRSFFDKILGAGL